MQKWIFILLLVALIGVSGCTQPSNLASTDHDDAGTEPHTHEDELAEPQANIEVTSLHHYIAGSLSNFLQIYGEVQNTGDTPANFIKVRMNYTGKSSVQSSIQLTTKQHLSPGEKSPFSATISDFSSDKGVTAEVFDFLVAKEFNKPLEFIDGSIEFSPGAYTRLSGRVRHAGGEPVSLVHVVETFYNANGEVVETAVSPLIFGGSTKLKEGDEMYFSSTVNSQPENITSYSLGFSYDAFGQ